MAQYRNALVYLDDFRFHRTGFRVENGRFAAIGEQDAGEDLGGAYVLPGLVDIHTHGNSGADFSDADGEGLRRMAQYLARHGVTSFCPTSMTLPEEALAAAFATARRFVQAPPPCAARLLGIHMEGPFFSAEKCGAQNPAHLRLPDAPMFARLQQAANGLIRIACVAPELPGALPFIREIAAEGIAVSVAHTEADYDAASAAFDAGASHVTHLYNAMPPLLHRAPGVIGAAAEREQVTAELIVDGIHVHPSAVRAAFRLFGPGRICLISDALSACGMPDGDYTLGGQAIRVRGARATLLDGTLAGSAATLFGCMKNAVRFGVPPEEAVRAASHTPARVIGAAGEVGVIREGLAADLLLCSMDWELRAVYAGGQLIREN